ncbi:MAG: dihydroneopterin aldolase [Bacteroidia bacterium]|nr:dihydroneopterin aldolase [Bacteroidia bacterium]
MKIAIEKMSFFAPHGVFDHERVEGNKFEVDMYLETPLNPLLLGDNLEETVDYAEAFQLVQEVMEGESVKLLETLAGRILKLALERLHPVQKVRVRVAKLSPPLDGKCERTFVEAELQK